MLQNNCSSSYALWLEVLGQSRTTYAQDIGSKDAYIKIMFGKMHKDRIKNEKIMNYLGVAP